MKISGNMHILMQTHIHTTIPHTYSYANIIIHSVPCLYIGLFVCCSLASLGINFSELNALHKVASLTLLSHCRFFFLLDNLLKNYQRKEVKKTDYKKENKNNVICLIKNAESMAQFTNLSIRLSLRQCESINLQLSVARATTLINHTETERESYMAAALHLSLSLAFP